jgi:coenzyme PQQ synthesis protein D (PqqD)
VHSSPSWNGPLPRPASGVIYKNLGDGAVLLSLTDEVYFGLNDAGSVIWEGLASDDPTFDGLCHALGRRYPETSSDEIARDTAQLLRDLMANHLAALDATSNDLGAA